MSRIRYVPHDAVREEEKEEDRKERKAMFHAPLPERPASSDEDVLPPDVATVEAFAEFLYDEEREQFNHLELREICFRLRLSSQKVKDALGAYGLSLEERGRTKAVRGFNSNNHDLFQKLGMCGGSGHDQISGFAGKEG